MNEAPDPLIPVTKPEHFDPAEAAKLLSVLPEGTQDYHRIHLNRYLVTLDRLWGMPRNTRVLEVGAAPFGMSLLMEKFLFDRVEVTGFAEDGSKSPLAVYVEPVPFDQSRTMKCFNTETTPWPFPNESFDLVVACEILEHLCLDPMHAMSEINRVLVPGGKLLVTTPNAVGISAMIRMITMRQPNSFAPYRLNSPYRRHNREFTPLEIANLFSDGGFKGFGMGVEAVNCSELGSRPIGPDLLKSCGLSYRGDLIITMGEKVGSIFRRYPLDLYFAPDLKELDL
jgi:SAM-dependent methyltransferase